MTENVNEKKVSLIIPAYNEEKRIGGFLTQIDNFIKDNSKLIHEIIVVDDGSTDGTTAIVEKFKSRIPIKTISLNENSGKGAAVQRGILDASGDIRVFMDADGATPIDELPKMLKEFDRADIVIGNRWMPGSSTARHSVFRKLSGWVYRTYMSFFGLKHIDTMCGFKGYKKEVAIDLFKNVWDKGWLFDSEIAYKAVRRGYNIKNLPIRWESKDGSKLDSKTLIKKAFELWPLIRKIKKNENHYQVK